MCVFVLWADCGLITSQTLSTFGLVCSFLVSFLLLFFILFYSFSGQEQTWHAHPSGARRATVILIFLECPVRSSRLVWRSSTSSLTTPNFRSRNLDDGGDLHLADANTREGFLGAQFATASLESKDLTRPSTSIPPVPMLCLAAVWWKTQGVINTHSIPNKGPHILRGT